MSDAPNALFNAGCGFPVPDLGEPEVKFFRKSKFLGYSLSSVSSESLSEHCRRHNVTISGSAGPVLVLQHGFGTDLTVWNKLLHGLESHFQVVRMDLAGSGSRGLQSYDPARYDHIEAHADDLLRVLGDLDVDECYFVGASVGSMVGLLASIERPKLFRKVICIGASPRYLNDHGYIGGFEQDQLDAMFELMSRDYQGWISGFAPLAVRGLAESEAVQEFSASLFSLRPDIALSTARTIFQSDLRKELSLVQVPVVLLQTCNDIAVPGEVGEYLSKHIRNSVLEALPVEGHFPHLSAPEVVLNALQRHLS
jgi:pimeloyl-ACP methyl ester carboxylesterase